MYRADVDHFTVDRCSNFRNGVRPMRGVIVEFPTTDQATSWCIDRALLCYISDRISLQYSVYVPTQVKKVQRSLGSRTLNRATSATSDDTSPD